MVKLPHSCTHLTSSKMMLKILQPRLQHFVNHELPDVQARFRKGRGSRDQIANINYIVEKARKFQKNICFWLSQSFWLVIHTILWKTLQEMGIPDQLSCLLRNLYAAQEATVRTRHRTTDLFQMGKGICQGCGITALFSWVLVHTRFFVPSKGLFLQSCVSSVSKSHHLPKWNLEQYEKAKRYDTER